MRAAVLALTVLVVVTAAGCSSSPGDDHVASVRRADSDVLPRPDWACAQRSTFRAVAPPEGMADEVAEVHSEPTADAFAEDRLDHIDTPVMVITVAEAEDEATYAYLHEGEVVEDLVVARQDDGTWIETEHTTCA